MSTWIGAPVLRTFWPRTSPSVVSMAIVRTVFSPKCCATSSTTLRGLSCTSRAVRMGGRPLSNLTSTTAPMTVAIWPMLPAPVKSAEVLSVANPCAVAGPKKLLLLPQEDAFTRPLEVALITALEENPPLPLLPLLLLLPNPLDCCCCCCLFAATLLAPAALHDRTAAITPLLPPYMASFLLLQSCSFLLLLLLLLLHGSAQARENDPSFWVLRASARADPATQSDAIVNWSKYHGEIAKANPKNTPATPFSPPTKPAKYGFEFWRCSKYELRQS